MEHVRLLKRLGACNESIVFAQQYNSFKEIWAACPRGDWMLWLAKALEVDVQTLTLAKAYCAKTVYHLLEDERSKDAIVAAINFGRGLITDAELQNTAAAAATAADAAAAAYTAAYTAAAAAYTATAATAAATAADAAAYTATAATAAATAADAAAYTAEIKNRLLTANICRKYLTQAVFIKLNLN